MRVIDVPDNNLTLTPPPNWDEAAHGRCETIRAHRDGEGITITWEFEPEEFAALLKGGKLRVKIFGGNLPPLSAWVGP